MSEKYSLNSSAILRSEPQYYNTYVVFDYNKVRTEFLTNKEFRVLEYIYHKPATIDEIFKKVGMEFKRCKEFLKRMKQLGFIDVNIDRSKYWWPKRVKDKDDKVYKKFPIPLLSAPTSVDVFITSRCNLNCVHCFSSRNEKSKYDLSIEDLKSIFNQLEELGVLQVRINGGEPLLHPEMHEIFNMLKEKRFRKVILTNGTMLDEEMIRLLKDSKVTPTISIDDSETEEHDLFRKSKGSFSRTIEGLKLLQKNEVQYGINCCLNNRNLKRCEKIINLAIKYGAYRIAFLDLKPSDRLRANEVWIPSYNEYQNAMPDLIAARFVYKKKIDISLDAFLHCYPLSECTLEAKRGYISCKAGRTGFSIGADGSIYPCNLVLYDQNWNMGNIKDERMSSIWFSEKWLYFRGGVKRRDIKKCKDCEDFIDCKDFYCRLISYTTNGDFFGPHPKCS